MGEKLPLCVLAQQAGIQDSLPESCAGGVDASHVGMHEGSPVRHPRPVRRAAMSAGCHQAAQGQVRVLRSALEDRWTVKLETSHAIWPWLVEYASFLICRGEAGHDGKSRIVILAQRAEEAVLEGRWPVM